MYLGASGVGSRQACSGACVGVVHNVGLSVWLGRRPPARSPPDRRTEGGPSSNAALKTFTASVPSAARLRRHLAAGARLQATWPNEALGPQGGGVRMFTTALPQTPELPLQNRVGPIDPAYLGHPGQGRAQGGGASGGAANRAPRPAYVSHDGLSTQPAQRHRRASPTHRAVVGRPHGQCTACAVLTAAVLSIAS